MANRSPSQETAADGTEAPFAIYRFRNDSSLILMGIGLLLLGCFVAAGFGDAYRAMRDGRPWLSPAFGLLVGVGFGAFLVTIVRNLIDDKRYIADASGLRIASKREDRLLPWSNLQAITTSWFQSGEGDGTDGTYRLEFSDGDVLRLGNAGRQGEFVRTIARERGIEIKRTRKI